jgi:8-oxo-dGTP diphosphatase
MKNSDVKKINGTNIVLLNNKNAVLLQLRDNKPTIPYPNRWALPGGHIGQNETPRECIIREVKEELGIELQEFFLFVAARRSYGTEHTYWARTDFPTDDITLSEGQEVKWFTYDEVRRMDLIYEDNDILDEFFRQRPFVRKSPGQCS